MQSLADSDEIAVDDQKGIILGEVRSPDFRPNPPLCTANGSVGPTCPQLRPIKILMDFMNDDLLLDMVALHQGPSDSDPGSVSVFFGNGDGTFRFGSASSVGVGPVDMESGDLNGDGTPDLVVLNAGAGTYSLLLGSRAGRLPSDPQQFALSGASPRALALRDLDGDRDLDILIVDSADNEVTFLKGDGRGRFAESISNPPSPQALPSCGPVDIVALALDADPLADFVVACEETNGLVVLRSRTGFETPTLPALKPTKLLLADFNRDGLADILTIGQDLANAGKGKIAVVMSNRNNLEIPLEFPPVDVALANFDRNGILDLVVADEDPEQPLKAFFGRSDGTFEELVPLSFPEGPVGLSVGDLNRDGSSDIVVANRETHDATVVLSSDVLASHHPVVRAIDFEARPVGEVRYLTAQDGISSDPLEGDGRFVIFNVPPGLTVVKTVTGGSGNKTIEVYPGSVSVLKMLVLQALGNAPYPVQGVTVDAVLRPVGDVDLFFVGSGVKTFSAPLVVRNGSVTGGADYLTLLEGNSEYIVRASKVGGVGAPPVPGDFDFDSIDDRFDDCPGAFNPDQTDTDGDTIGDVCDPTPQGGQ